MVCVWAMSLSVVELLIKDPPRRGQPLYILSGLTVSFIQYIDFVQARGESSKNEYEC